MVADHDGKRLYRNLWGSHPRFVDTNEPATEDVRTLFPSHGLRVGGGAIIVIGWNALTVNRNLTRAQSRVSASCRGMLDACSESRLLAVVVSGAKHRSPSQDLGPSGWGAKVEGWKQQTDRRARVGSFEERQVLQEWHHVVEGHDLFEENGSHGPWEDRSVALQQVQLSLDHGQLEGLYLQRRHRHLWPALQPVSCQTTCMDDSGTEGDLSDSVVWREDSFHGRCCIHDLFRQG
jgi:hypothetical protein